MNQGHSHVSCDHRCDFDGRNVTQKWNNYSCQCECKKPIRHRACEDDHARSPGICACNCDKDCENDTVLLAIACLLLLVTIVVKYYMKRGLTTPCLLSFSMEMGSVKEIDIKNLLYILFDGSINTKNLDPNSSTLDEKPYKSIFIYFAEYVTPNIVKHLYLIINNANRQIENNGNKYLTLITNDYDEKYMKTKSVQMIIYL